MSIEPLEPLESIESIEPIESSNVEQIYTVFLTINNDNFIKQNDKYFVIEPIYIQYIGFFFCVEILHFLNTNTNINFLVEHQNFYFDIINGKDNGGRTCLMLASTQGDLDIVEFLLVYGANINESDNSGQTCLMCACDKGDIKMVQLLLDNGANINDKDIYGANCLMYALKSEYYMNDITLNITKLLPQSHYPKQPQYGILAQVEHFQML